MIDITGDGPTQIAIQRAYDVLGDEGTLGVVGYLELHPDDPISVLKALDRIETRRNRPSRRTIGPATANAAKSMRTQPRWPKRAWRTVPKGWSKSKVLSDVRKRPVTSGPAKYDVDVAFDARPLPVR